MAATRIQGWAMQLAAYDYTIDYRVSDIESKQQ